MLNTIRRAGSVLTLFTEERPDWGVREMAAELGIPRSNAHELLSSLATIGLLQRTPDARYRLGWRLLTLSGHLVNSTDVARIGSSVLSQLAHQHGQTAGLATLDNGQVLSIGQVEPHGSAPVARVGDRLPAHSTASGKILLSHLDLDPGDDLEQLTPKTITDIEILRRQLAVVRRNGVAFDLQETDMSISCVAAPIRDGRSGAVIAALTLCVSPEKFSRDRERYIRSTVGAARRVSYLLTPDALAAERAKDSTNVARVAHVNKVFGKEKPDAASA